MTVHGGVVRRWFDDRWNSLINQDGLLRMNCVNLITDLDETSTNRREVRATEWQYAKFNNLTISGLV